MSKGQVRTSKLPQTIDWRKRRGTGPTECPKGFPYIRIEKFALNYAGEWIMGKVTEILNPSREFGVELELCEQDELCTFDEGTIYQLFHFYNKWQVVSVPISRFFAKTVSYIPKSR